MTQKTGIPWFFLFLFISTWIASPGRAENVTVTSELTSPTGDYITLSSTGSTTLATDTTSAVGIGTVTPASTAIMDISASSKGVLFPHLTSSQRTTNIGDTGLGAANNGLLIYNTDLHSFQYYDDTLVLPSKWNTISSGSTGSDVLWQLVNDTDMHNTNTGNVGIGTDSGVSPPAKLTVQNGDVLFLGAPAVSSDIFAGVTIHGFAWYPAIGALVAGDNTNLSGIGGFHVYPYRIAGGLNNKINLGAGVALGESNSLDTTGTYSRAVVMGYNNNVCNSGNIAVLGSENLSSDCAQNVTTLTNITVLGKQCKVTDPTETLIGTGALPTGYLKMSSNGTTPNCTVIGFGSFHPTMIISNNAVYIKPLDVPASDITQGLEVGNPIASATVHSTNPIIFCSDARLKENIVPLGPALDKLAGVRGIRYELKARDPEADAFHPQRGIGVIAQELEKAFPELVMTGLSGEKYKAVDYDRLNAVLVQAVQELHERNLTLKRELADLKKALA